MGARSLFFLILSALQFEGAAALIRGPYLQSASSTSAIVRWRTDFPSASVVRYGTQGGNLTEQASTAGTTTEHQVALTGLTPHTQYFYSVGDGAITLASGSDHYLTTSPTNEHATRLWIIGDSGTGNSNARAVRDAFLAFNSGRSPDVWLMLGDNAYYSATDAEHQTALFNMYPMILRNTPAWATFGNHEGFSANSLSQTGPYFDIFSFPTNAQAGGLPSGTEAYYSFDYGLFHFICLESTFMSRATNGPMLSWLRADLAATTQRWIIAYFHHSPYSKSHHDSDVEADLTEIRATILPVLEEGGVDLILTGHSHVYERSILLNGHYGHSSTLEPSMILNSGNGREDGDGAYLKATDGKAPNQGTVYAVVGSSGQTSGGSLDHPVMVTSQISLGSLVLDIETNRLFARFLNQQGVIRDYFTLLKGVEPPRRPSAPSNLAVSASGSSSAQLTWTDNSGGEQRYILQRSTDGSNFVEIARFPADTTTFVDTNLYASTEYYYRIRAGNQGGDSTNSNLAVISTPALPFVSTGPSTAVRPYLLPAVAPVGIRSVYTTVAAPPDARDQVGGRRMTGSPAGLGFLDNGSGTLSLLLTHHLEPFEGSVRMHGAAGSFISRLIIRGGDLTVQSVADLITNVFLWSPAASNWIATSNVSLSLLALGDLPRERAFYNSDTTLGTRDRIFLAGEEAADGRLFAHFAGGAHLGSSLELSHLGRMAFRQAAACQERQNRTVISLVDRSGRLYFYLGNKATSASNTAPAQIAAAGLTGGRLYALAISNVATELTYLEAKGEKVPYRLVDLGQAASWSSASIAAMAATNGSTLFTPLGGGSWDPNEGDAFYFSSEGGIQGTNRLPGRVWKLKFNRISQPELGGTIQMILEGKEGVHQPGSLMIDEGSSMLIAEAPGDDLRRARVFLYDLTNTKGFTNQLQVFGIFDPVLFGSNGLTRAEQVMGMVDLAPMLGPNQYMLAARAPYPISDPELVEGGQILFLHYLGVPFPIVETVRIGSNLVISWNSTPYATYNVQGKTHLFQSGWTDVSNVFSVGFRTSVTIPLSNPNRFFRVRRIR